MCQRFKLTFVVSPPPLFVATFQVAVYPTKSPYDPRDLCRGKVTRTLSQLCLSCFGVLVDTRPENRRSAQVIASVRTVWLDAINLVRKSRRHVFELGNASTGTS